MRGLVIYKAVATESLTMSVWTTQIGLGIYFSFFFFFWWEVRSKDGRVDVGEMGNKCDLGALYEIPK